MENYINSNGRAHGFIYPAHFLPKYKKALELLKKKNFPFLIDPSSPRFAYSTFSQTKGIVELPYLPDKNNVLSPAALRTISELRTYATGTLDWQLKFGSTALIAPYHFCRDLNSEWLDIDIKLIEESISYARSINDKLLVLAGVCLNIESYTTEQNRTELLNRYSRVSADGYIFYADEFDERSANAIQIKSYLELMKGFQKLGKPVVAGRVGTLGLGFLAAGIDAATSGIASLSGFSENNLLVKRNLNYDMSRKYYIPKLMITVPFSLAEDILSDARNAYLRCDCSYCKLSPNRLEKISKLHFLESRSREVNEIQLQLRPEDKLKGFISKVDEAFAFCEAVRKQQVFDLKANFYSHIKVWKDVFSPLV